MKRKITSPGSSAPPTKQLAQSRQSKPVTQETRAATRTPPPPADPAISIPATSESVIMSSPSPAEQRVDNAGIDTGTGTGTRDDPPSAPAAALAGTIAGGPSSLLSDKLLKTSLAASPRVPVHVTHIESINKFYIVPVCTCFTQMNNITYTSTILHTSVY